jgi:F0F1-type ATP synthase membrane subunit b/b'
MSYPAFFDATSWMNYPGLELWKFINLGIFLGAGIYILRRPLRQALVSRREGIRQELLKAQKAKEDSMAQLAEAEALLARLDSDLAAVRQRAKEEADLDRQRQAAATELELEKLRQQALREVEIAGKIARQELKAFLASRSVQLAKESLDEKIGQQEDAQLIASGISELRRNRI